ncbi:hypothetical protein, variant [Capsaspora owczarzaki ATCC 30864]|nr:hypothetical protein, variant [Capsaspora owczarzaki ATCC 30864]
MQFQPSQALLTFQTGLRAAEYSSEFLASRVYNCSCRVFQLQLAQNQWNPTGPGAESLDKPPSTSVGGNHNDDQQQDLRWAPSAVLSSYSVGATSLYVTVGALEPGATYQFRASYMCVHGEGPAGHPSAAIQLPLSIEPEQPADPTPTSNVVPLASEAELKAESEKVQSQQREELDSLTKENAILRSRIIQLESMLETASSALALAREELEQCQLLRDRALTCPECPACPAPIPCVCAPPPSLQTQLLGFLKGLASPSADTEDEDSRKPKALHRRSEVLMTGGVLLLVALFLLAKLTSKPRPGSSNAESVEPTQVAGLLQPTFSQQHSSSLLPVAQDDIDQECATNAAVLELERGHELQVATLKEQHAAELAKIENAMAECQQARAHESAAADSKLAEIQVKHDAAMEGLRLQVHAEAAAQKASEVEALTAAATKSERAMQQRHIAELAEANQASQTKWDTALQRLTEQHAADISSMKQQLEEAAEKQCQAQLAALEAAHQVRLGNAVSAASKASLDAQEIIHRQELDQARITSNQSHEIHLAESLKAQEEQLREAFVRELAESLAKHTSEQAAAAAERENELQHQFSLRITTLEQNFGLAGVLLSQIEAQVEAQLVAAASTANHETRSNLSTSEPIVDDTIMQATTMHLIRMEELPLEQRIVSPVVETSLPILSASSNIAQASSTPAIHLHAVRNTSDDLQNERVESAEFPPMTPTGKTRASSFSSPNGYPSIRHDGGTDAGSSLSSNLSASQPDLRELSRSASPDRSEGARTPQPPFRPRVPSDTNNLFRSGARVFVRDSPHSSLNTSPNLPFYSPLPPGVPRPLLDNAQPSKEPASTAQSSLDTPAALRPRVYSLPSSQVARPYRSGSSYSNRSSYVAPSPPTSYSESPTSRHSFVSPSKGSHGTATPTDVEVVPPCPKCPRLLALLRHHHVPVSDALASGIADDVR